MAPPGSAGTVPSWTQSTTKEATIDSFAGAIFRDKKDENIIYIADAPTARNYGGTVELMLCGPAANGPRKWRKYDWIDSNVEDFAVVLSPAQVFVGGRASVVTAEV